MSGKVILHQQQQQQHLPHPIHWLVVIAQQPQQPHPMILIAPLHYFHLRQMHQQIMAVILKMKTTTIIITIITIALLSWVIIHLGENRVGPDLALVTITTSQHQGPLPRLKRM